MMSRAGFTFVLVLWVVVTLVGCTPSEKPVPGQTLFEENCAVCHGLRGDGKGQAAYLLQPKPRNFRLGQFRLISTDNGQPTRQDLLRTIRDGMPGTGMPSWDHLSQEERSELVDYVLQFNREGWIEKALQQGDSRKDAEQFGEEMIQPGNPILIAHEPQKTAENIERGHQVYVEVCAKCHGEDGEGMRDPSWKTAEGFPTWSRALKLGVFKGGNEGEQLYLRMAAGLPGTPMPASESSGEDVWNTVHYIQSLFDPQAQERARVRSVPLRAQRVSSLPTSGDDARWDAISEQWVPLMPLWWHEDVVSGVRVKAVHDGEQIAFRLQWDDSTKDIQATHQTSFPDAAAIELTADPSPPLFAMGAAGEMVNIWHWKAVWEEDQRGYQEVGSAFPSLSTDAYYGRDQGWNSQPFDDPLFSPAMELDNSVALRKRPGTVEDANAAGFGTYTPQAAQEQNTMATSRWEGGVWRMQMMRELRAGGERDVPLQPAGKVSVAFAVWNGSAGDRDGQKAVSIWSPLTLDE